MAETESVYVEVDGKEFSIDLIKGFTGKTLIETNEGQIYEVIVTGSRRGYLIKDGKQIPFKTSHPLLSLSTRSCFIIALILAFSLTVLSLVRSEYFPWPDFVHTKHGFPIFWLTHQTSAISGPVDWWLFDYWGFAIDTVFWFCIVLLSLWILRKIK